MKTMSLKIYTAQIKILYLLIGGLILSGCNGEIDVRSDAFVSARENAELAHESLVRSHDFTSAWLKYRDPVSGLIPSNLDGKIDLWEPHNAAADNYAFMVLTAYLLDKELYEGPLTDMLNSERKLTSRVGYLPDTWSFSRQNFNTETIDTFQLIFGTSEYIKDGLLPLSEYIGDSPWQDRLIEMLDDLSGQFAVLRDPEESGSYRSAMDEVNGEMLQTLSRIFWMTGDKKYLEWAVQIGDYYLLGDRDLSSIEYLRLRDHGCEVIGGLSELYLALHYSDPGKKEEYREGIYRLLDRILEVGRNEDGLFYNVVNTKTGEIVNSGIADTWGYTYNAYYTVYLVDEKEEYRQAFLDCIGNLNKKYRNYDWEHGSHDGYADAIESGINLYNREPETELKEWIDSEIRVMWDMQQENGIIGGWHGDGNFARTAIMHALWKTQGVHSRPWNRYIRIGSEMDDNKLCIIVSSENDYSGKIQFDYPRHRQHMQLPVDYPRINQFPEWFTVEKDAKYKMFSTVPELNGSFTGKQLVDGLQLEMNAADTCYLTLEPVD